LSTRKQIPAFSALELIVAMAIVAILLGISIPAFKNYGWNLRMRTAMHTLRTDLNLARSRAISLGVETVICPAPDSEDSDTGPVCSGDSLWHTGWIVFADLNGDRQRQSTEPILSQAAATQFITISSSRYRNRLRFYPRGTAAGSNATILFCDQRGSAYAGAISLSNTGRIRLVTRGRSKAICP